MTATLHEIKPATFDEFWKIYPRRTGKLVARVTFEAITTTGKTVDIEGVKIHLQASAEEIVEGAKRYRKSITHQGSGQYPWNDPDYGKVTEEMRYLPHPATWLNKGRWEDGE